MAIYKYLDCTTGHVTANERDLLDETALAENDEGPRTLPVRVIKHAYGWWVNVPTEDYEESDQVLAKSAPNLLRVIQKARELECYWVNLDSDGAELSTEFPLFDW